MRQGGGKNKGSEFERLICRRLSKWISGKERPELFWRSASSGAKSTMDHRQGKATDMYGDIMSVSNEGSWFTDLFVIECKFYKEFDFGKMLEGKGKVLKWWDQACGDAILAYRFPLLIFKKNRNPIYVMYSLLMEELVNDTSYLRFKFTKEKSNFYSTIALLEEWLDFIDPETLKQHSSYLRGKSDKSN